MMLAEWQGNMWGINRKTAKTYNQPGYKHFIRNLAWNFKASNMGNDPMEGSVTVHMTLETNHDIDAVIKQTLDALQMAEVFGNDKQVNKLFVTKKAKEGLDKIGVTVIGERDKLRRDST